MRRLKAPERRKQLIEVATRLFAERGFDATTTAGIATGAGVSEPILYRHFKSKQDLFVAIVTEVTKSTQDHWRKLISSVDDPADAFRVICQEWPDHMRACATQYSVIHSALVTSRDAEVIAVVRKYYEQMEGFLAEMIEDGQRRGVFRPGDSRTPARWIMHAGIGFTICGLTLGVPKYYSVPMAIELTLRALCPDGDGDTAEMGDRACE